MDQKLFEQLLTEVVDWEYPTTSSDDASEIQQVKKIIRQLQKKGVGKEEIQQALAEFRNDSLPPKVINIKPVAQECPDCGKACPNGRTVDYRLYRGKKGQQKWCGKCAVCKKQSNPKDGKYTLSNMVAANTWWEWIRTTGVDNPRGPGNPRTRAAPEPKPEHLTPEYLKKKYGLTHLE